MSQNCTGCCKLMTRLATKQTQGRLQNRKYFLAKPKYSTSYKITKLQRDNMKPIGQYSQTRQMRTAASTFRGTCFDILKTLTANDVGLHFVRCVRTDLADTPEGFHPEIVRQQLRALAVVSTILTTQQGYSYSVSHNEFLRRYKFLAFDFDETVEDTIDNCRLLLLRLKLEGWTMGKTKVFLKYYNKEYLTRLYETQIKKIVKVQSMMRAFMGRRKLYAKIKRYQDDADPNRPKREEENDHHQVQTEIKSEELLEDSDDSDIASNHIEGVLDETQKAFIRPWFKRWRTKSIFQVLLLYRAERMQNLANFCLQIHMYNQNLLSCILKTNHEINLEEVNVEAELEQFFPPEKPSVHKLPFVWESLILRGDVSNCQPLPECNLELLESKILGNTIKNSEDFSPENLTDPPKIFTADKEIQTCFTEQLDEAEDKHSQLNFKEETEIKKLENEPDSTCNVANLDIKESLYINEESNPKQKLDISNKLEVDLNQTANKDTIQKTNKGSLLFKGQKNSKRFSRNSSASNQETQQQPKFKNSLQELEEKFKQTTHHKDSNEEPPFNFRTLLRKTKNSSILIKDYKSQNDLDKFYDEPTPIYGNRCNSETVITEIAPGILIHGKIADL